MPECPVWFCLSVFPTSYLATSPVGTTSQVHHICLLMSSSTTVPGPNHMSSPHVRDCFYALYHDPPSQALQSSLGHLFKIMDHLALLCLKVLFFFGIKIRITGHSPCFSSFSPHCHPVDFLFILLILIAHSGLRTFVLSPPSLSETLFSWLLDSSCTATSSGKPFLTPPYLISPTLPPVLFS